MLEAISVPALLARPRGFAGNYAWTRTWWTRPELVALKALCERNASLEKSADSLGRTPTSIAHRARDAGIILPKEWRDAIIKRVKVSPRADLQYPYIVNVRGEHAELLAVNALVPRHLSDHARADICQEMMLALWLKQVTLEELQHDQVLVRGFIRRFNKANLEGSGFALSLDVPMRDGRSWYDVLPEAPADDDSDFDDDAR